MTDREAYGVPRTGSHGAYGVAYRVPRTGSHGAYRVAYRVPRTAWREAGLSIAGVLVALAIGAGVAEAQFIGGGMKLSGALGLSAPIGDLDKRGGTGFGVAIRTESPIGAENWSLRGDFSFDRFSGKNDVDSYQFFTLATNLVHRTNPKLYQFGGFGIYTAKTAIDANNTRNESAFGVQGGVGLNLTTTGLKTFVEIGITDVFTTRQSSVWFPVRFGIRI